MVTSSWEIKGHTLEYIDSSHQYLVDGIRVPSITQILKKKFGNKYKNINKRVLHNASIRGTKVHEAIEKLCKYGVVERIPEVRNFTFLQKKYGFDVIDNEVPIILFDRNNNPIAGGRLDLVLKINDLIGGADIKRTSALDKEYLAYQLNLYRIGYRQSYDVEWQFLKGIHLKDTIRKFIDLPINEEKAWELIDDYFSINDG